MLTKRSSALKRAFFFKNLSIITLKYSTIKEQISTMFSIIKEKKDFIFDRNFDFKIFLDFDLTFSERFKYFFKRTEYEYDPYDEIVYPELSERLDYYNPDELMTYYYHEYWNAWNANSPYFDIENEKTHFINFKESQVFHYPVKAENMGAQYPFEMYAEYSLEAYGENYKADLCEDFDSTIRDPYTNEILLMPLTTLRWNYYILNFLEQGAGSKGIFTISGKLLTDLEENNDLVSSILETIHEPEFRNTIEFDEFLSYSKFRVDVSFIFLR